MTREEWIAKVFEGARTGRAVEVGAHDGVFQSITLPLERLGWDVMCIEGNTTLEPELRRNRAHVIIAACSNENRCHVPYYINDTAPMSYTGLISHPNCTSSITVLTRTLTSCLEEAKWAAVDLLCIDVEGMEAMVLEGMDFTRWRPRLMFIENWLNNDAILDIVAPHGYERVDKVEYDEVYVIA